MSNLVIVHVWESRGNVFHSNVNFNDLGHASIEIPDESFYNYLSFWPASRGGKIGNAAAVFILRESTEIKSYKEDCKKMEREADHSIRLTNIDSQAVRDQWRNQWLPIREMIIQAANQRIYHPNPFHNNSKYDTKYNLLESNCSTYVGRALVAGCAKANFLKLIPILPFIAKGETIYWEPGDVLQLARTLKMLE